jgi:hypothetical protein
MFHLVADYLEHASDLPVNALAQDDAQSCGRDRM